MSLEVREKCMKNLGSWDGLRKSWYHRHMSQLKNGKLPSKYARGVVGAAQTSPRVWMLKLACGHVATRRRTDLPPRETRCVECARIAELGGGWSADG